ncbi:hypothetical protein [Micromonospora purpureochromogenes]|uniref:DUF1579 domain-containing protein n=1 Tax=Micromonospora purpureochromogenes TaxID=47872 RepID=A0A1C4YMN3_9ACTN|nr:hypothetical protein [Micromonospora purpureochromogenes]NYF59126.1 hypothetical protein [Micromonospora purpureochromogenes]SCF22022.1 hypothetical protein GA0074696_3527 [Micromonospora purpureochromogenes]
MSGDFDFLAGRWDVANRRLTRRHVGSDDWDEFPGTMLAHRFFAGAGSFDEMTCPTRGFSGATVRIFDPVSAQWSIYWMHSQRGQLELPPVVGGFTDQVGTFYADDSDEGRPIRCRFVWSGITATSCRWEQAFSIDDGTTWETNWIMDFTRAG